MRGEAARPFLSLVHYTELRESKSASCMFVLFFSHSIIDVVLMKGEYVDDFLVCLPSSVVNG